MSADDILKLLFWGPICLCAGTTFGLFLALMCGVDLTALFRGKEEKE